jgi:hypothetical protein
METTSPLFCRAKALPHGSIPEAEEGKFAEIPSYVGNLGKA